MNKTLLFLVLSILVLANVVPVFADKVFTDITVKERITVPGCPATQQTPKLLHEQQDKDGNKIKIYCSQGRYLMQYVTSSGTTYYVGGCFFDSGVNVIYKQVHYDKYTKFDNGTKKGENGTFYRTWWHNFNAPQLPVRTATNASDYEFEFDPVTEILIKYNTVHNGSWVTGRDYHIINETQVSNKTIANPDDPQKLISYLVPRAGEMTTIPTDYAFTTPLPVTVYDNGKLSTVVFTQFLNGTFDTTPISAKEGIPFTFDINMPGEELGVVKYSLSAAPDGMTIDRQNGIISWTPKQGQSGNHDIAVKIQDGMGSALYRFTLPVESVAEPQTNAGINTLEDQFGNATTIKLIHNGSIVILNQTSQKLAYKMGENITVNTELINIGNKTVTIGYSDPLIALEIKDKLGNEIWPNSLVGSIPELVGTKTLQPGEHFIVQPWGITSSASVSFPTKLDTPGNYTVVSLAIFTFYDPAKEGSDHIQQHLWSKPLQITVTNETIPEFPLAVPILLVGITSLILLYRIKFQTNI